MRSRSLLIFGLILLLVAGCSPYSFGSGQSDVDEVDSPTVVRSVRYYDSSIRGPRYEISLTVPEAWVGQFETLNRGNSLVFRYLHDEDDKTGSPIFYVEALSNAQYWEQIGSYPGQYNNIVNTADTYFIYHLPVDAFYSNLEEDEFEEFADAVPEIVRSVEITRID